MAKQTNRMLPKAYDESFLKEIVDLYKTLGSARAVARHLGRCSKTIALLLKAAEAKQLLSTESERQRREDAVIGYAPDYDLHHELPPGLRLKGTSILRDADGNVSKTWDKSTLEGRTEEEATQVPSNFTISKIAKLRDQTGATTQEWTSYKPDQLRTEEMFRAFVEELRQDMPREAEIPLKGLGNLKHLLTTYIVTDSHIGALVNGKETGGKNWDIKIGEDLHKKVMNEMVARTPDTEEALLIFLGDIHHYDSSIPETPASKHRVDADGRYSKMVRSVLHMTRYIVNRVAEKHKKVRVIFSRGNHDPSKMAYLNETFAMFYENNDRIEIEVSPNTFHYFEWGANLFGVHHGHGAKFEQLPMILATDMPEAWGRTKHRLFFTGHVHSANKTISLTGKDFNGCSVESFRTLFPGDAWAWDSGYRSQSDQKALVFHRVLGEMDRFTVNPAMFAVVNDEAG